MDAYLNLVCGMYNADGILRYNGATVPPDGMWHAMPQPSPNLTLWARHISGTQFATLLMNDCSWLAPLLLQLDPQALTLGLWSRDGLQWRLAVNQRLHADAGLLLPAPANTMTLPHIWNYTWDVSRYDLEATLEHLRVVSAQLALVQQAVDTLAARLIDVVAQSGTMPAVQSQAV